MSIRVRRLAVPMMLSIVVYGAGYFLTSTAYPGEENDRSKIKAVLKDFGPYQSWSKEIKSESKEESIVKDASKKSNQALLAELQEDPYDFGYNKIGKILVKRGGKASSDLLKELERADGYYLCCLVNMLSEIPSKERDEAFIRILKKQIDKTDDFLQQTYVPAMIKTLAENHYENAIPAIQEYATRQDFSPRITVPAKIALGLLGKTPTQENASDKFAVAKDQESTIEQPWAKEGIRLLNFLLGYGALNVDGTIAPGEFSVESLSQSKREVTLKGRLPNDKGRWSLEFGDKESTLIPFYYTWHTGPLAAGGWIGVIEERDEKCALVYWQETWIS